MDLDSEPDRLAILCAQIAGEKKARDILILDIERHLVITKYFVIASALNKKQLQAIADEILKNLKKMGAKRFGLEGYGEGMWILIDYGDVICQLFLEETRSYYDFDLLWGDAPRLPWKDEPPMPKPAGG
jgi:ribosome-associated protein